MELLHGLFAFLLKKYSTKINKSVDRHSTKKRVFVDRQST